MPIATVPFCSSPHLENSKLRLLQWTEAGDEHERCCHCIRETGGRISFHNDLRLSELAI